MDCCAQFYNQPDWKAHTSCVTEQEKYHGSFYTPKKKKGNADAGQHSGNKRSTNDHAAGNPSKRQKTNVPAEPTKKKDDTKQEEPTKQTTELFSEKQWTKTLKKVLKNVGAFSSC